MSYRYLEFVKAEARKNGKTFFIDSGEGQDWVSPDGEWWVERMTGWLIDEELAATFEALMAQHGKNAAFEYFGDQYHVVRWEFVTNPKPGEPPVTIRFEYLPSYAE